MSTDYHPLNCGCRACGAQPIGNSHWVVRRTPARRRRVPLALFGLAIVAVLILFSSL